MHNISLKVLVSEVQPLLSGYLYLNAVFNTVREIIEELVT